MVIVICKVTHCKWCRGGHCGRTAMTVNDLGYCSDVQSVDPEILAKIEKLKQEAGLA